jgi:hypothetical protein
VSLGRAACRLAVHLTVSVFQNANIEIFKFQNNSRLTETNANALYKPANLWDWAKISLPFTHSYLMRNLGNGRLPTVLVGAKDTQPLAGKPRMHKPVTVINGGYFGLGTKDLFNDLVFQVRKRKVAGG